MKPLACVRHEASAPLGVIEEVLETRGVKWQYVDCWNGEQLPDPGDISGLMVLGGAMNANDIESHPYLGPLRTLTRRVVEAGLPFFGICLGAQILARSLGAEVHKAPAKEIGFVEVEATTAGGSDPVLGAFAPATEVFQWHEDACRLPEGADLLFRGDAVPVQAFRWRECAYGAQFHFEVTLKEIAAWADETADMRETWGTDKKTLLEKAAARIDRQSSAGRTAARAFTALLH